MSKSERELRQDIVDIGKLVYQKGWVAANDGNKMQTAEDLGVSYKTLLTKIKDYNL